MKKLADATSLTESEHIRTHRRWASTVLALYGIIISVGFMATLVHKSWIVDARPPAIQVAAQSPIR
jgi:hypothetical protein